MDSWITVSTSSGMFSSECAVSLKLADGREVSFFADKNLIRETDGKSLLKVTLVNTNPESNNQLVLLPTETFETSTRWVEVPAE
jgi:small ligand-binding sensory domain FIST